MTNEVIREVARDVFGRAGDDQALPQLWTTCVDLGWNQIAIPEGQGGSGGDLRDFCVVVEELGRAGAAVPLVEDATVRLCLSRGPGLDAVGARDLLTVITEPATIADASATVNLEHVPWARAAHSLLLPRERRRSSEWWLVNLDSARVTVEEQANLAGEPRDGITITGCEPDLRWSCPPGTGPRQVFEQLALYRGCQILGAMKAALQLAEHHAGSREQFGRPIRQFQAVGHQLAEMRAGVALAAASVESAIDAFATGEGRSTRVAAMRSCVGMLSTDLARRAHQIHGAMGLTQEHALQTVTKRIWSYRDEVGTQRAWTLRLGHAVAQGGSEELWAVTAPWETTRILTSQHQVDRMSARA